MNGILKLIYKLTLPSSTVAFNHARELIQEVIDAIDSERDNGFGPEHQFRYKFEETGVTELKVTCPINTNMDDPSVRQIANRLILSLRRRPIAEVQRCHDNSLLSGILSDTFLEGPK